MLDWIELGKNTLKSFEYLFFPDCYMCEVCGLEIPRETGYPICEDCLKKLPFIGENVCERCGSEILNMATYCERCKKHVMFFDKAVSVFTYTDVIRKFILKFKNGNSPYLAPYFAQMMYARFMAVGLNTDIVTYVPLTKSAKASRGYNQSELLARWFSFFANVPYAIEGLVKVKKTAMQKRLNFEERQFNLKDCFQNVDVELWKDKRVLLIDDLMTTGATMNACCSVIAKGKPKSIYVLTLASTRYVLKHSTKS